MLTKLTHLSPDTPVKDLPDNQKYLNRELSWLRFNLRVVEEANNPSHPLLERLRFLSISGNNLDEFYMVRVAGLRGQKDMGIETLSDDGLTPAQQLAAVSELTGELYSAQQETWSKLNGQ